MSTKTTMLEFPGFSPLWRFGTEYRDAESKWHHGRLSSTLRINVSFGSCYEVQ